ncbi:hypothetical protein CR513_12603, partial [Mucuna pruriens]
MDKGLVQVKRKDNEVVVVHQEGKASNTPRPLIIHYPPSGNTPKALELQYLRDMLHNQERADL